MEMITQVHEGHGDVVMGAWAVTSVPLHQERTHTAAPLTLSVFPQSLGRRRVSH